jgi:acyl carrier protein
MPAARFANQIESKLRGVVAERLGVGPEDLRPDVSLTDDLAADSLDLIDLGLALETECGVVLRRGVLESVRTYGDLLVAVAAEGRRAARRAGVATVFARARVVPARGNGAGLERCGELTPYEIEILVADALRAGPGARLEMEVPASTDEADLAAARKRFAWLAARGVAVSVRRDHRAA